MAYSGVTPAWALKPHKGEIHNWHTVSIEVDIAREYYGEEPGLGFIVEGTPQGHPSFTDWIHTSWVVEWEPQEDGSIEIETRNSRYTLRYPRDL